MNVKLLLLADVSQHIIKNELAMRDNPSNFSPKNINIPFAVAYGSICGA